MPLHQQFPPSMSAFPLVKITELGLGDVVELFEGAYGSATVKQIKDSVLTFFRPYTHTAEFAYTGGVICYVGMEVVVYQLTSTMLFKLLQKARPEPK